MNLQNGQLAFDSLKLSVFSYWHVFTFVTLSYSLSFVYLRVCFLSCNKMRNRLPQWMEPPEKACLSALMKERRWPGSGLKKPGASELSNIFINIGSFTQGLVLFLHLYWCVWVHACACLRRMDEVIVHIGCTSLKESQELVCCWRPALKTAMQLEIHFNTIRLRMNFNDKLMFIRILPMLEECLPYSWG